MLEVYDHARGNRLVERDAAGRIARVQLADGTELRVDRDRSGAVHTVQASDGTFVEATPGPQGRWRIDANDCRVDAVFRKETCVLSTTFAATAFGATASGELRWDRDRMERLTHVRLPGLPSALRYVHSAGGGVRIGWPDGSTLLRVSAGGSIEWADGIWEKQVTRLSSFLRISDAAGRVCAGLSTDFDLLRRPVRREWSDGVAETFRRDQRGRLQHWERTGQTPESMAFEFDASGCIGRWNAGTFERWALDEAGRVLRVDGPSGEIASYEYDVNGRRVRFRGAGGRGRYVYDALGQLRSVERDGFRQTRCFDGLGRRCSVDSGGVPRYEHRDPQGRLWCVTSESGALLYAFIWLDDRPLARLEGGAIAEVFLCDDQATLLGVCAAHDGELAVTLVHPPPFGAVSHEARPTLHGHFGDPVTGLINFGAREYDPATASFLTPDQFHGAADDPRRWAGAGGPELRTIAEAPYDGIHAYALSQFDPVGRADHDGHLTAGCIVGWILNIPLSLTWGWPFTAVSAFFFLPMDLYFELIGRIVQLFVLIGNKGATTRAPGYSTFPWPNHSIFGTRVLAGSLRQGQVAFSFNGFLPRVISGRGIDGDRATTIGQVIWIRQGELNALARPRVVRAYDLDGGAAGVTAFNQDPSKHSVLAITCSDKKGKQYVHVSHWARGPGNTIVTRGGGAAAKETFGDLVDASSGHKPCFLHLAKAIPLAASVPRAKDDKEKLSIAEYVYDSAAAAANNTTVQIDSSVAFAIRMKANPKVQPKQWLQLTFPDSAHVAPVYVLVGVVDVDSESFLDHYTIILYKGFPRRVIAPPAPAGGGAAPAPPELKDLDARRIVADDKRAVIDGWTTDGANTAALLKAGPIAPADLPDLHKGDLVLVTASTAAAAFPTFTPDPPPANDTAGAAINKLTSSVKLTAALAAAPAFGTAEVRILRLAGKRVAGSAEDHATPEQIKFTGIDPDASKDDLVAVSLDGAGAAAYALVTDYSGSILKLQWLSAAPVVPADKTPVFVQRVAASKDDDEKATAKAPAGDAVDLELPRTKAFTNGAIILFKENANQQIGTVKEVSKVRIELSDDVVGTVDFKVQPAKIDGDFSKVGGVERATLQRFLKQTGGAAPSAYKSFPDGVISIVASGFQYPAAAAGPPGSSSAALHEFYIRSDSPDLQKDYQIRWRPFSYNGANYFLLERDLPMYIEDGKTNWYYDRDEPLKTEINPPADFQVYEYLASGATRSDHGTTRVLGLEAEALVPEEPNYHFTYHDSLIEHETHHSVQSSRYGPFMGALPVWSLLEDAVDFGALAMKKDPPGWLHAAVPAADKGNQGFSWWQIASLGGIMTLAWKYFLLLPFYASTKLREAIDSLDYNDLMKVMSPIWSATIRYWPRPNKDDKSPVDPANPYSRDAGQVIAEFFLRAMDMRSWMPFVGMIPLWLGDGPRNFVEQQASRASGDLYSTILSANDEFNRDTCPFLGLFGRGSQDADLKLPLGAVSRMMIFAGYRDDRLFLNEGADQTGWSFAYQETLLIHPPITITTNGGGLVHPALYQPTAAAAPPTVQVEGPDGNPATFDNYGAGATFTPKLRAMVPVPGQVGRAAGFYFAAAAPGVYHMESYDAWAADPKNNAKTAVVDLTFENAKITFGGDDVPWTAPGPPGGPPAPALSMVKRFYTETADLKIENQDRQLFQITQKGVANLIAFKEVKTGWTVEMAAAPAAAPAAPAQTRVRIFRILKKNDPDPSKNDPAFDLYYGKDTPELKDVRSMLDKDLWLPVHDFVLQVDSLPNPADVNMKSSETKTVSLALSLQRPEKFTLRLDMPAGAPRPLPGATPVPTPATKKIGPSTTISPRGEDWQIGPLPGPIEETATFKLEVEYGPVDRTAKVSCKVTVDPVIRVTGPAPLLAKKGSPLTLNTAGASGALEDNPTLTPSLPGVAAKVSGTDVVITVDDKGANIAAQDVVVTVKDSAGNQGRRTIKVSRP